ncbi:hypothetical protein J6TS1_17880 [Siminovitchia terrae]|uniref:Lipoprotein n=1 Tax=Siminovitchia terrae TaxID=1914933 RepID=A0ABQ4KV48_SIMTE|nr:hypothetical protein [Siminovitchia terrae]GIN93698.1 hypothetical protein J22TS1_47490 [Siminovitchia terrae]GIN95918.1 hypothetical protein J6TS1_17880 [Siminovitchia terrae]
MIKSLVNLANRRKYLILSSLILSTFLFGCGPKSVNENGSDLLNIPDDDKYTYLFVQGVDENGAASQSEIINDDQKIEKFISHINKIEVVKPSNEEIELKNKELNQEGNYIIALSDSKDLENKVYYMTFFKDGSIYFQHSNKNVLAYTSKEKDPELLKEIKELLDIDL